MFTSDININSKRAAKTAFVYLIISLFLVLFGAVYEIFSHGVYSYFMLYAFAFPLAGGVLPFFAMHQLGAKGYPSHLARFLYHSGIATLTVGSLIRGVLDIYGTTNALTAYYWYVGGALWAVGIISFLAEIFTTNKSE